MRIVIYQDYLRVGGTESQTVFLATQFQKHGHQNLVLTNRPGGPLAPALVAAGIPHESLQCWDTGLNWFAPGWARKFGELTPDLLLLMGRNANRMGWRIRAKHPQIPMVATMRTGRHLPGDYLKTLRVADKILCNSNWAARRLERSDVAVERIEVHPNACVRGEAIIRPKGEPCNGPSAHAPVNPRFTLLYVAAMVPGKNHLGMLDWLAPWLKQRKDVRLLLVGEGPERRRVERQVAALEMGDQVMFTGFVQDMPNLYGSADLAISASLEESMPNSIVEAQYAGLPVVALDVAGVGECLVDGKSGFLVPVGDEPSFLERLDQLLSDASMREEMGKWAREFAKASFDPQIRVRLLLESLEKVANAQAGDS